MYKKNKIRLTNEDIEELKKMRKARPGYSGMKYGGMKKKKLKVKKAALGSMTMGNIKMSKSSGESKKGTATASAQNIGDTLGKTEKVKEMLGMAGMKTGGMSKTRGTGCAIRGTNFKGIF